MMSEGGNIVETESAWHNISTRYYGTAAKRVKHVEQSSTFQRCITLKAWLLLLLSVFVAPAQNEELTYFKPKSQHLYHP